MANHARQTAQVAVADENSITIYGLTVGELVRQSQKDLQAVKDQVSQRDTLIVEKDKHIKELERRVEQAKARPEYSDDQVKRAMLLIASERGMQTLPDGSVRLTVTVPADAAATFKAWAEGAGEDPASYIGRQVEEALLAYSMS